MASGNVQCRFLVLALALLWSLCVIRCDGWFLPTPEDLCANHINVECPDVFDPDITRNDVFFLLNKRDSDSVVFDIDNSTETLTQHYNPELKTAVIIHGYLEHSDRFWIREMSRELLIKDAMNVLVVDWYRGANAILYFQSVANARVVGEVLGDILQELVSLGGDPGRFHMIGFSLGSHLAGFAGSRVAGVGRITGLDPAGGCFEGMEPDRRLDPSDALLVDVIHTDGRPTIGMGTMEPMGTIDFYPHGGMNQPGCPNTLMQMFMSFFSTFDFSTDAMKSTVACGHIRAPRLFSGTINYSNNNINHFARRNYHPRRCATLAQICTNQCQPCDGTACPLMGYNLDPATVETDGPALYRTSTIALWPYVA